MEKLPERAKDDPWDLKTAPGTSSFMRHTDEKDGRRVLVCTVGSTVLLYDARCVADLHAMLTAAGDWVELGGADEQKPAKEGTVEAWGRATIACAHAEATLDKSPRVPFQRLIIVRSGW